jgi:single-stranded-DNA-specific exonuclease
MAQINPRSIPAAALQHLLDNGYSPALARIFAARGITDSKQLDTTFAGLLPFDSLKNAGEMARLLADAISAQKKLMVIADYDADGATACAVAVRGLRAFGAHIDFIVPNRFEYGYGLTPEIVQLAAQLPLRYGSEKPITGREAAKQLLPQSAGFAITSDLSRVVSSASRMASSFISNVSQLHPDILITVDNGIASVEGVAEANRLGMKVFITDHHLPGDALPDAACIVNPNQPGCGFPSKNLAGVGVMFYVLLALRAELRSRGAFDETSPLSPDETTSHSTRPSNNASQVAGYSPSPASGRGEFAPYPLPPAGEGGAQRRESVRRKEPNLASLLDLVALGTVADVVKLDQNNRILVQQGLQRIRAGRACAGINALLQVAKRNPVRASSQDLGFTVGPRLNAAGRLDDMSLGINCLLTDNAGSALQIAAKLDALNRERRSIETDMQDSALASLEHIDPKDNFSLTLFDKTWHQGVIGILASRLKDKFHRPTIAFARSNDVEIKGSGRSIAGLHLRDALDLVSKRHPSLIRKFGGHAAAAGLSIAEADFENFVVAFEQVASELLSETDLAQRIETDGALETAEMNLEVARLLDEHVWGQGFPAPQFSDKFVVQNQRVVGEKHLKLQLRHVTDEATSHSTSRGNDPRQVAGYGEASRLREQMLGGPSRASKPNSTVSGPILNNQGKLIEAILFGHNEPLPEQIHAVYSLSVNEYNGTQSVQLIVRHWRDVKK